MASTSTPLSLSSPLIDAKSSRQSAAASAQCVTLPALAPPPPAQSRTWKATSYCRKAVRNVASRATGDAPATEVATTEVPEIVKKVQEFWDKLDDKYAVSSLAVAGLVALYGSTGLISAIDKLPLIPGVLELVGIGYTGWFAYKNLIYKPDREALLEKVKGTYEDIIGSSS